MNYLPPMHGPSEVGSGPVLPYFSDAIIYTTTSKPENLKRIVTAIDKCFQDVYSDAIAFAVEGVKVPSGVAAQPLGDGIRIGAENRLKGLERRVHPLLPKELQKHVYFVALQKGITDLGEGNWVERYFVIVKNVNTGKEGCAFLDGAPISADSVAEAKMRTSDDYEFRATGYAAKAKSIDDKGDKVFNGLARIGDAIAPEKFI